MISICQFLWHVLKERNQDIYQISKCLAINFNSVQRAHQNHIKTSAKPMLIPIKDYNCAL